VWVSSLSDVGEGLTTNIATQLGWVATHFLESSSVKNSDTFGPLLILGVLILFAFVITFSGWFGVDWKTGGVVILQLIFVAVLAFAACSLLHIPIGLVFPLILSGVVWAFLPILDFYAYKEMGIDSFGFAVSEMPWYGRWYFKGGLLALPLISAWGINRLRSAS